MKPTRFLLRVLNVRVNEWDLVKKLFLYEFFQGAGIAFFFTASFALFLDKFDVSELPKVFIYSAFLLWLVGYLYSKLEARMSITALARYITLFMAASFVFSRIALEIFPQIFLYWMMAWFYVLYLLNNLEFWGMSSLLFDVRQSKRLFGLISAGDIPAKFIGYTLALLVVGTIGTSNLLIVGFFCLLFSLPFIRSIERLGAIKHHGHPPGKVRQAAHPVGHLLKNFSTNVLIRRIALLTLITSSSFLIVNFVFYVKVKDAVSSDVELAQFIALFFAIARVIALFVKMIFTGRLINRLGIIPSLMITPVLMLLLVTAVYILDQATRGQNLIVYLFGAMAIIVDVLRTSINTPVFLTLMQPLGTHERLRAHTIMKGIMDPFSALFTGILLLLVFRYDPSMHLHTLNFILLALGFCWIVGIYRIHKQYLKALLKTIGNRFFSNAEFSVADGSALEWLAARLQQCDEREASNILKLVARSNAPETDEIILSALQHASDSVKVQALQLAMQRGLLQTGGLLKDMLQQEGSDYLKGEAIRLLTRIHPEDPTAGNYLEHHSELMQRAAISGLLQYGKGNLLLRAAQQIEEMVEAEESATRRKAAIILQELEGMPYSAYVKKLLEDRDAAVRREAFAAAGKMRDAELLSIVMNALPREEKEVLNTLIAADESALPLMEATIGDPACRTSQAEKLLRVMGRIGGPKAHEALIRLMDVVPERNPLIIKTLYHSNYKVPSRLQLLFERLIRSDLEQCARILYMQKLLSPYQPRYQVLANSLQLELDHLRDTLLLQFALLYDREQVRDVRAAFQSGKKEAMANAMEILEMTVKKDTAQYFNTIFEAADLEHRTFALRKLYPSSFFKDVEAILCAILAQEDFPYNHWTRACSIYTTKKQHHTIDNALIIRYIGDEHPLLSEVARYAI